MISKNNAYSLIQKSGNLPTLPAILLKLLAACDNDQTPLSEIADIISKDPALSFKVLQLVNSAYYGFRYSFKGIEQAVIYLGANTIKNLAVTMSVHQVFERKRFKNIRRFNISVFWYQSLMCATLARRIAQKIGFSNVEEAYLSGLLHDIGRMILISTFPKEHEIILLGAEDRRNTLWAETQLLGVTHCEAGSWLVQKWKLNSMMADAIRYHHVPLEQIKEAFLLVKIVYISNFLNENSNDIGEKHETCEQLIGLDLTDLVGIIEGATEEVEQIASSLGIKIEMPSDVINSQPKQIITNTENSQNTATSLRQGNPSFINEDKEHQEALQEALTTRIKSVALLSSLLESLVQAGDVGEIIAACEEAMSILFNIEKVLFFLADKEDVLLRGHTSPASSLHQMSQALTLTLQRSSSLIVKTYHDLSMTYLTDEKSTVNLADEQILTALKCNAVLLVPLVADKKPVGVILLGLPRAVSFLAESDCKLVQLVAQQVGLCLQLERMKEQKTAELDAERMAAVSMTARKVAHEINNPLGIISNYITSMKLRLSDDEQIQNELTIIDEEIHRISSMIGQIDMFSNNPVCRFELTDVNATIEDIIQFVKPAHLTPSEIDIAFLPDDSLPQIMTSKDTIKQIMINLIKNAAEAMNNGGSVVVKTRQLAEAVAGKEGIEIVVADTGPGLPESVAASLYTPFVTTKQNEHSGLGLSIVHKTVTDLGGTISYTSSPTDGTSFSIFLPNSKRNEWKQRGT